MLQTEEMNKRLKDLQTAAQSFFQYANVLDGNFQSRQSEITALEIRRDKLKSEVQETQEKVNDILQKASEESAALRNEALSLLEESKNEKLSAKQEKEEASRKIQEANALLSQALERQKTADNMWRMAEERRKKIEEAVRA